LAIELAFDSDSDRRLGRTWSQLSALYGGPTDSELGIRPHITLALFRTSEPEGVSELTASFAAQLAPFGVSLATVGQFPTSEGVVYLSPAPSLALARAHELLYDLLGPQRELVHTYYQPGAWHPHCTMAINVPAELINAVVSECRSPEVLSDVRVERVQVVRYRPATEISGAVFDQHETV
jgi:2'-5' RNA ligase